MYRFRKHEIELMKEMILLLVKNEQGKETPTAWRYRNVLEGMCSLTKSKRKYEFFCRRLALYESLTENDLPNWI